MKKSTHGIIFSLTLSLLVLCSASPGRLVIHRLVTGPIDTNCYLIYDAESKEAALIDVGGSIDSLTALISENDLNLKYIFATHCHMDHIEGIPAIKAKYPDAKVCFNKKGYEDLQIFQDWFENNYDPKALAQMKQHPGMAKWFEMDVSIFGEPDIYIEDNQVYELGGLKIKTLLSPGHSRGSICFHVADALFSGDVLFYRSVGSTSLLGGSQEDLVRSVNRLYTLPDQTKVYPGHGPLTDIGTEKEENKHIKFEPVKE